MSLTIREATIDDYEAVCALFAQIDLIHHTALPDIFRSMNGPARSLEFMQDRLDDANLRFVVAEQDNEVVGLAEAAIRNPIDLPFLAPRARVYIEDIIVDERFRGTGVGSALLAHIEDWTRSLGITRIELTVWEFNTSARAMYEHRKFRTLNRNMSKDLDG